MSNSSYSQEDNEIRNLGSLHNYRTEIPNIIFELLQSPCEFKAYCVLKRTAGDVGRCFKCNATLAEEVGCSVKFFIQLKKSLEEAGLIRITKRTHSNGGNMPDLIEIIDIWPQNMECMSKLHCKNKSKTDHGGGELCTPGGVNHVHEGGEPGTHKEDHIQEDHKLKGNDYGKNCQTSSKESLPESLPVTQGVVENSSQKFPLRNEQKTIFQEIKSLNLECTDEKLTILIRKYWHKGEKFIKDCIHHMRYQISLGVNFIKGRIAFFTHCLNEKQSLITERCLKNMQIAKEICSQTPDFDIKITEKYVQCNRTLKEVGTNLDQKSFVLSLQSMYELSKN